MVSFRFVEHAGGRKRVRGRRHAFRRSSLFVRRSLLWSGAVLLPVVRDVSHEARGGDHVAVWKCSRLPICPVVGFGGIGADSLELSREQRYRVKSLMLLKLSSLEGPCGGSR